MGKQIKKLTPQGLSDYMIRPSKMQLRINNPASRRGKAS